MKIERLLFHDILTWMKQVGAVPGVGHWGVAGRIYWTDSPSDMEDLFQLYMNDIQ